MRTLLAVLTTGLVALGVLSLGPSANAAVSPGIAAGLAEAGKDNRAVESVHWRRRGGIHFSLGFGYPRYYGYGYGYRPYYYYGSPYYYYTPRYYYKKRKYRRWRHW